MSKFLQDNDKEMTVPPRFFFKQVSLQWTNQLSITVKENITIYGCGRPLGHVIKIIQNNFCSPVSRVLDKNSDLQSI